MSGTAAALSPRVSTFGERLIRQPEWLLVALIAWHYGFWVLAPVWSYSMLPLDTLELLGWGQEWQLGYWKHPPLGAWIGEAVLWLAGGRLEAMYLLAQTVLAVTLIYVWQIARLYLDRQRAVLAAVLLEGAYWYTVLIPNFNMNTLQLPLWAGLVYHFLRGLDGARVHWLGFGVFAAAVLLAKYSGLLLLASCALLLVATRPGRAALGEPWFWAGCALGLLLLLPHLYWLLGHWQLPLEYLRGFGRAAERAWQAHLLSPLRFGLTGVLSLIGCYLLVATLYARDGERPRPCRKVLALWVLTLGPLLLAMSYGALSGARLKSTWAFPLFNLAGILLLLYLPTRIEPARMRRFALALALWALAIAALHLVYKTQIERSKTAWDGAGLAAAVDQAWRERHGSDLPIIIGDHMLTAIVSAYAPGRPRMLIHGDFRLSPWLDAFDLERGAALLCRIERPCTLPDGRRADEELEIWLGEQRFRLKLVSPRPSLLTLEAAGERDDGRPQRERAGSQLAE